MHENCLILTQREFDTLVKVKRKAAFKMFNLLELLPFSREIERYKAVLTSRLLVEKPEDLGTRQNDFVIIKNKSTFAKDQEVTVGFELLSVKFHGRYEYYPDERQVDVIVLYPTSHIPLELPDNWEIHYNFDPNTDPTVNE